MRKNGKIKKDGNRAALHGNKKINGRWITDTPTIVRQNHLFACSSQRILVAKKIAAAQNHAARPFPGFPK
jgi:hypothetical protein